MIQANPETAVLLLHGYLSSSSEMIHIKESLEQENYIVHAPDLAGHGTTYADLHDIKWNDWTKQVEDIYNELRKKYKKVYLAGHSFGGLLSLYLGSKYAEIDGIILINHVLRFPLIVYLCPLFKYFLHYVPNRGSDIKDTSCKDHFLYEKVSVKNSTQLLKLSKMVEDNLHLCTAPLLIFKSKVDHRLNSTSNKITCRKVSSVKKELIVLHNSYHVAVLDHDRETIIKRMLRFLTE